MLQTNPNKEENLSAPSVLAKETGKTSKNYMFFQKN